MFKEWRKRRRCFHHERPNASNDYRAESWIISELFNMGANKAFVCDELKGGCGKVWIV
jgi:hypothetical protein